jgi:hypothetical protein
MAPSVLETLRLTLGFFVANAGTLFRLIWFPILILALSDVYFSARLLPLLPAIQSGEVTQVESALRPLLPILALGLLVPLAMTASAGTAVLRFIILGEGARSRQLIYLAPGRPMLRVTGVILILSVIVIAVAMVLALFAGGLATLVPSILKIVPPLFILVLTALSTRWLLAFPIAAAAGRIDFAGAWTLSRPIYRSLLALVLVLAGVIIILNFTIEFVLVPRGAASLEAMTQALARRWPLLTLASFASNLFTIASFFTLLGIVYRLRVSESERLAARGRPAAAAPRPDEPTS